MARDAAAFEAPYGENGHTGERVKDAYLPDARADVGGGDALCEIFSAEFSQSTNMNTASAFVNRVTDAVVPDVRGGCLGLLLPPHFTSRDSAGEACSTLPHS